MATSDSMSAIRKELVNSQRVIVVINSNDYNKYKPMLEKLPDSLVRCLCISDAFEDYVGYGGMLKKSSSSCVGDIRMSLKFSVRWQM